MSDPLYEVYRIHLNAKNDDDLFRIDDWLHKMVFGHPGYEIYDRTKDIAAIERLERAIVEISNFFNDEKLSESASELISLRLMEVVGPKNVRWVDCTKYGPLSTDTALDALHFLDAHHDQVRRSIASTRTRILNTKKARRTLSNVNVLGIKVVSVARDIWKSETGKRPPKKELNPASPFALFLQDLLEAMEVPGEAVPVFRAWRREHDRACTY